MLEGGANSFQPEKAVSPSSELAVVPVHELLYPSSKASATNAAKLLIRSFENTGLAYLHFDGRSKQTYNEIVRPAFQQSRSFFSRSVNEKSAVTPLALSPGVTRGYIGTAAESGAESVEWKEAFSWSYDWDLRRDNPQNSFEAVNIWPSNGQKLKTTFDKLFQYMYRLMLRICDALEDAVEGDLRQLCEEGETISLLRAFHYHASHEARGGATGSCAHTDWGFATFVVQEAGSSAALQAHLDGKWQDIPPREDTIIVNCSDFLSLLSRGKLKSPLHRVVLTEEERFSFVYFQYPGFNTAMPQIEKASNLSLLKNQKQGGQYLPESGVSFGEFIAAKWAQVSRS